MSAFEKKSFLVSQNEDSAFSEEKEATRHLHPVRREPPTRHAGGILPAAASGFAEFGIGRAERVAVMCGIGFVIVLFGAAVCSGGPAAWAALRGVPAPVFGAMLGLSGVNYACRALRWLLFSRAVGVHVPARLNALYYVAGFSMTTTPGKLGEALRLWLLRRAHGCRYADTAALLIADRLWDAVAMAMVLSGCMAFVAAYRLIGFVVLAVALGVTAICLRPALPLRALRVAASVLPRRKRMLAGVQRSLRRLAALNRADVFLPALGLGVAGWLCEGISLFVLARALGLDLSAVRCVFIFAFSMIVGAVSVLPGGLGSTEASMAGLLTLQHVALPAAIVATAVVRVTTLWFAVGLGLLALPAALRLTGGVAVKAA
jgi:uncharacterized protein (TIRG00374 family)